jgi:isopentenyl diphosphate isomerase/L-lactate dehydrogenase-like FMN-dependent dehydrogenase
MASEPEACNVADYERLAAERIEPGALGYFSGGAGDERTLRDNVGAYARWRLRPRMLVDVGEVSTATTVLGEEVSSPIGIAPVAFQRLAHPDGEPAMARAAASTGSLMCLSTIATATPREVCDAAPGGTRWFQLYLFRDRGVTMALAEEAIDCGYSAIALTVDAPRAGRRERDIRNAFVIPPEVRVPSLDAATGGTAPMSVHEVFAQVDPTLTWKDLERLCSEVDVPVLVKGVLTAEDARLAVEHGAGGVIVSNHGGRQLDGVQASLDALPEVVEEVDGRVEVLVDGGIRRGTDALIALALGARAVLVGRPALWGLAVDGEDGARRVLGLLRDEFELALCLSGCASPASVSRAHISKQSQA